MLIFNPSCLPHGGRWPQRLTLAPLPRDVLQPLSGAESGHPFLERAGQGGHTSPRCLRGCWLVCAPRGSPAWVSRALREGDAGARAGMWHWPLQLGGPRSGLSHKLLCKRQQPLPGNVLAGGTRASKQTDAAPAVGRRAGSRFPSALSHPGAAERRGEQGTESCGGWRASPSPQQGGKARCPPKSDFSGGRGAAHMVPRDTTAIRAPRTRSLCREKGEQARRVSATGLRTVWAAG